MFVGLIPLQDHIHKASKYVEFKLFTVDFSSQITINKRFTCFSVSDCVFFLIFWVITVGTQHQRGERPILALDGTIPNPIQSNPTVQNVRELGSARNRPIYIALALVKKMKMKMKIPFCRVNGKLMVGRCDALADGFSLISKPGVCGERPRCSIVGSFSRYIYCINN